MTTLENTWFRRDPDKQQSDGAVRADTITGFAPVPYDDELLFTVALGEGRSATLGSCPTEDGAAMADGFLSVLYQAQTSDKPYLVIEALPITQQDGSYFWWVHEQQWPQTAPRQKAVPTARR